MTLPARRTQWSTETGCAATLEAAYGVAVAPLVVGSTVGVVNSAVPAGVSVPLGVVIAASVGVSNATAVGVSDGVVSSSSSAQATPPIAIDIASRPIPKNEGSFLTVVPSLKTCPAWADLSPASGFLLWLLLVGLSLTRQ